MVGIWWEVERWQVSEVRGGLYWRWSHLDVGDEGLDRFEHESDARKAFDALRSRGEVVRLVKVTREVVDP